MKKLYLTIMIVAIISMSIGFASAANPDLMVSGFTVMNGTAEVGHDFTLAVNLVNTQSDCAYRIRTSVSATDPFIVRGVSSVNAGDFCNGTKTVLIPMAISSTATGGTYPLTINNDYESVVGTSYSSSDTINVFVSGSPDLSAHIVSSNPVDIFPGDTATITVSLENDGTFEAQDVNAVLSTNSPLEIKWSSNLLSAGVLGARQSKSGEFTIEVPKDAAAISYPLKMSVNYLDENRQRMIKTFDFNFTVDKKAQFDILDAGTKNLYPGDNSKQVSLEIKNTGTNVAKNVKVKMEPQFPFSTDGSVRFIKSLAPGESAPVDFKVYVDKDATIGNYGLTMLINFEDEQGKALSDTTNFNLEVKRKNIFQQVFLDYWFLWLVAIVIVVIVIRRKSKKKN